MQEERETLTLEYLDSLKPHYLENGYPIPKWIEFSETLIKWGCEVELLEAKTTYSKYLYVKKGRENIKVRFSNHKPSYKREANGDSDYYVGVGNFGIVTTEHLLKKLELEGRWKG